MGNQAKHMPEAVPEQIPSLSTERASAREAAR